MNRSLLKEPEHCTTPVPSISTGARRSTVMRQHPLKFYVQHTCYYLTPSTTNVSCVRFNSTSEIRKPHIHSCSQSQFTSFPTHPQFPIFQHLHIFAIACVVLCSSLSLSIYIYICVCARAHLIRLRMGSILERYQRNVSLISTSWPKRPTGPLTAP
jgi:hypothetical protein